MSIIGNTFLNIEDSHLRVVSGNVYAQAINISGINLDAAHGLQSVTNTGNQTFNTLQFSNAITGFVTTANAQIGRDLVVSGNTTVSTDLTVSANATVADTLTISEHLIASKEATVTGNLHVTTIRSDSNVVTEYTGPHDRPLRKYPEVAMTSASQGGYVVTQSGGTAYLAFDEDTTSRWYSGSDSHYDSAGGAAITDPTNVNVAPRLDTNTDYGDWLAIEVPTGIKIESFKLMRYDGGFPSSGTLYAKNSSGDSWTEIYRYDGYTGPSTGAQQDWTHVFHVNSTIVYKNFALVGRVREAGQQGTPGLSLKDWELYGHEEGSGSLDTTLKTVYNVPATTGTQLEVYYDAKGESTVQSPIPDLSPNTNTGALSTSPPTLDTTDGIESFKFDASSSQRITSTIDTSYWGTNKLHSVAFWFKADTINGKFNIFHIGNPAASESSGFWISDGSADSNSGNSLNWWFYGGDSTLKTSSFSWVSDTWYHTTLTFDGSTKKLYVNGKHIDYSVGNVITTLPTGIPASASLAVGSTTNSADYFDGSIANFRVYGAKVLNADQVKELYDYQKDYFLGSKSQVTLYKGHLGVGVTEPSGQLELAGDERIQEYPPRALTGYETLVEGHGVFCASASSDLGLSYTNPYDAFSKATSVWITGDGSYSSGLATNVNTFQGVNGAWLKLKLPYKINLKKFKIQGRNGSNERFIDAILYASTDDNNWDQLRSIEMPASYDYATGVDFDAPNTSKYYNYFLIQITKVQTGTGQANYANIGEWRLFGTPGPTTLDKGSLTLGRSLDVPRISRYDVDTETPRPEKLLVDFDTTVNNSPTDISGKGHHGTFNGTNTNYSSVDKAFDIPDAGNISATLTSIPSADFVHSVSVWVKFEGDTLTTSFPYLYFMGVNSNYSGFGLFCAGAARPNQLHVSCWTLDYPINFTFSNDTWYHVTYTYSGGGWSRNSTLNAYVNGIEYGFGTNWSSGTEGTTPTIATSNVPLRLGTVSTGGVFDGKISNFKLYSVVLEPSEVKKLYRLGRTGRSMVISDTAVGIGKVPEAQLDVRGNISCDGVFRSENPIAFEAYYTDGTLSTTGTYLPNYVRYNYGGCYDQGTGRFYAPINGIYAFHWHAYTNQGDSTSRIFIDVNGGDRGQKGNSVQDMGQQLSFSIYLNAGDFLLIKGKDTYPLYFHGHTNHNMYSGHLVIAM